MKRHLITLTARIGFYLFTLLFFGNGIIASWIATQELQAQELQKSNDTVMPENGAQLSSSDTEEDDLPDFKRIGPLVPGSEPYKEIAGTWEGEYTVNNSKFQLTLEIGKRGKYSIAIFIFQHTKKRTQTGSFEMKCEYSPKEKMYTLSGTIGLNGLATIIWWI